MPAVVVRGPNRIEHESIPLPVPGPDRALVKVDACSICGSDVKLIHGEMENIAFPLTPGHEWCGEVVEAPRGRGELVGRRVVSDILQSCKHCESCQSSLPNLCPSLVEPGLTVQGAFARYVAVPLDSLHTLPDAITAEQACMIEPLSVVLYALRRVPVARKDRVLILGGGAIGQLLLRSILLERPESVALADRHPHRLEAARRAGAHLVVNARESDVTAEPLLSGQHAPTVIFDAAGDARAFETALQAVRPGGRVGVLGYDGSRTVGLAPSIIMRKLLEIKGILSPTGTWEQSIRLLASGAVSVDDLLTHRLPLDQFEAGWQLAARRDDGAIRVVIRP